MISCRSFLTAVFSVLLLIIFFSITAFAHAESVVWSQLQPDLVAPGAAGPDRNTQRLDNAMVSISYNVRVSEIDAAGNTLRILPSGTTISQGTRVKYEFIPHVYNDIYWFGTGAAWDSPYGDWMVGAAAPPYAERCSPKNKYSDYYQSDNDLRTLFAALAVAPPTKRIDVQGGTCEMNGEVKICTISSTGTLKADFTFDATQGKFYPGIIGSDNKYKSLGGNRCSKPSESYGESRPMEESSRPGEPVTKGSRGVFTMQVPQQIISHTLTVTEVPPDDAGVPTIPTLSAGGACIVGAAHTISFTSTDPDANNIRYGVDWDANGSVDQWVPSSSYVPSGTTQSASRTYSTAGTKTVQVLAQDVGGLNSSFARVSFSCADANTSQDASLFIDASGFGDGDGSSGGGPTVDLTIRAVPSLVRSGVTTQVHWSATNVTSCTVVGTNGDTWSGVESAVGGETSKPITHQVMYTLSCRDESSQVFTKQAYVNVLPTWKEL